MPKEMPRDILNDSTKEHVFRRKNGELFKEISQKTLFDVKEVETLALIHRKIEEMRGPVTRPVFRDIFQSGLNYTENIRHLFIDRVFSQFGLKNPLTISAEQFIVGLSTILRGSIEDKTKFSYKIYDFMKTNKLTKDHMFPMLRGCFIKLQPEEDADDTLRDMIDLLVKMIDIDRDGEISEAEFYEAVLDKNLLFLECMGPVFPSRRSKNAFLTTFTDKIAPL